MKRFAMIGVAGYVAPRHLRAVQETGHQLVAAMDRSDSVGILDRYFPEAAFFTEIQPFEQFLEEMRQDGRGIDYLIVCTPNYLHEEHCRLGLRMGADVICEKPLVLNPDDLSSLQAAEEEAGRKIFTILQLRLNPELVALKERIQKAANQRFQVRLKYVTPRGNWYHHSWKGDIRKSGGIVTNIGIHLFDLLIWLFGKVEEVSATVVTENRASGHLRLAHADADWALSIERSDLPEGAEQSYRVLEIDGESIAFDGGFHDLHTRSYQEILEGRGFSTMEVAASVVLTAHLRTFFSPSHSI